MGLKRKVLVVDDEPNIRKYLKTVLEADGYAVETVNNGFDAISKIESGQRPDFIILDILMPVMNGLHTLKEMMCIDRSLDVIITSCSSEYETIKEAFDLGARDYLVVPYSNAELDAAMLRAKQRKPHQRERNYYVERRVARLSAKKQIEFWAASNL